MDVGAQGLAKLGVNDALGGLLGRWVVGFARSEFVTDGHKEMKSPKTLFESRLGVAFHYIFCWRGSGTGLSSLVCLHRNLTALRAKANPMD